MNFLFGSMLFSLVCISIPIYLHLYVVRKKVQIIPSLKLLQAYIKKQRKRQYQHILLMIFRILVLTALSFLLAQPFIQSRKELPLPPVAGESLKSKYLGIVLDDSISSADTLNSVSRLEHSINWLKQNINRQKDDIRYSVCSVSYPVPTGFMDKNEVLNFLDNVSSIPYSNNIFKALNALDKKLKEKKAGLLICAPRNEVSWEMKDKTKIERPVVFFDTTSQTSSVSINHCNTQNVTGSQLLTVNLNGKQELLEGQKLIITSGDFEKTHTISTAEAERKEITFKEKDLSNEISVLLNPKENSPFLKYYINNEENFEQNNNALIICQDKADFLQAKIIKAVLESDGSMKCDVLGKNSEIQNDSSIIILIGAPSFPARYQNWIEERIKTGVNILLIPGKLNSNSGSEVKWHKEVSTTRKDYPLRFAPFSPIDNSVELLLSGLDNMPVPLLREPQLSSNSTPALVTDSGKVLLSYKKVNDKSIIWALGFSLELDLKGPVYHPMFPMLIQSIFEKNKFAKTPTKTLTVGETYSFKDIFQDDSSTKLINPDNQEIVIRDKNQIIEISKAGFYSLNKPNAQTAVANYPRLSNDNILDKKLYSNLFKEIKWSQKEDTFEGVEFNTLDKTNYDKYDFTPIIAVLLLLFITGEEFFLFQIWRKKS